MRRSRHPESMTSPWSCLLFSLSLSPSPLSCGLTFQCLRYQTEKPANSAALLSMPAGILQNKKHNVACCLQSSASAGIRFAGDDSAHASSRLLPTRLAAALFARYDELKIPTCIQLCCSDVICTAFRIWSGVHCADTCWLQECAACVGPQYYPYGTAFCRNCSTGTYRKDMNSPACTLCPSGTFPEAIGATDVTACSP